MDYVLTIQSDPYLEHIKMVLLVYNALFRLYYKCVVCVKIMELLKLCLSMQSK